MISASPSPSATSCTRHSTSPFSSTRGAHASRGLPSSNFFSGSAAADHQELQTARVDR